MSYKLLLWDFDGTLADTLDLAVRTYNELAVEYGFRTVEDLQPARSLTTREFLKEYRVSLPKLPSFLRDFFALQGGHMEAVRLFPRLAETLHGVRRKGFRLGVLSSNARENILACLRANGVDEIFEFVVSYSRLLGKARAIRRVQKTQAVGPRELLYVGDEARDIEAARKAGVDVAAVTWGFHAEPVLVRCAPTYVIRDPPEILALLGVGQ